MNLVEKQKYEEMATVVKAMAHPTRLFIIDELKKQPHCVCELTEMVGADTSTVSKHLSVLKNAGIIYGEKRGISVFYHLRCDCVLNFYNCIIDVIETGNRLQIERIKQRDS